VAAYDKEVAAASSTFQLTFSGSIKGKPNFGMVNGLDLDYFYDGKSSGAGATLTGVEVRSIDAGKTSW